MKRLEEHEIQDKIPPTKIKVPDSQGHCEAKTKPIEGSNEEKASMQRGEFYVISLSLLKLTMFYKCYAENLSECSD